MITRDIKENVIYKLHEIQGLVNDGNTREADFQLSDIIDELLSSMVTVTYSREEDTSRPGDCEDPSDYVSRNID